MGINDKGPRDYTGSVTNSLTKQMNDSEQISYKRLKSNKEVFLFWIEYYQ